MKILIGDQAPDAGRITFDGRGHHRGVAVACRRHRYSHGLPGAERRPTPDRHREHLPRTLADAARKGRLAGRPRAGRRRARSSGVRHRSRPDGSLAADRRASGRRDRPGALGQHPLPDPRRTDRSAVSGRVRPAVRHHPATPVDRRRDHLHHPSPRRGAQDRRPRAGAARRGNRARRRGRRSRPERARRGDGRPSRRCDQASRGDTARSGGRSGHQGPRPRVGSVVRRCQPRTAPWRDPRAVRTGRRRHPGGSRDDLRGSRRHPPGRSSSGDGCRRSTARRRRSGWGSDCSRATASARVR